MPYLTAAVVLIGALTLLDLVLTLGVLRRLRDQAAGAAPSPAPTLSIGVGERPGGFLAASTRGEPVEPEALPGVLVGFFSPDCTPCRERVPQFTAYAEQLQAGRDAVLAVVIDGGAGDEDGSAGAAGMVAALDGVARVIVEAPHGPVARAFGVTAYPMLCLLDGAGAVAVAGSDLSAFPATILGADLLRTGR
ncbi:TlpA disulfide reductase family protein [Dactylosporangium sp. CA-233914]|uniref:TlpA disulfide reductase family protein n=1 Tax=Dactylosporangium sp. CA-233914 TaxID=3239934 RepID=UPI003D8D089C